MSQNTITLPDQLTGEPVTLHVPDCSQSDYFRMLEGEFYFCLSEGGTSRQFHLSHLKLEGMLFIHPSENCWQWTYWLPIIAAVAAEWWDAKGSVWCNGICLCPDGSGYAREWRRFTAKPKEGKG